MALTGNETLLVQGSLSTGTPSGQVFLTTTAAIAAIGGSTNQIIRPAEFVFNNGASALTTGMTISIMVPQNCTLTASTVIMNATGSISFTVTRVPFSSYPGTPVSIVASAPPTITSGQTAQDTVLSGWTKGITQYDILTVAINTFSGTATQAILLLTATAS